MSKVIVYENDLGTISIVTPVNTDMTIEQIAEKDVPDGVTYKIVEHTDLPTDDMDFRDAWKYDLSVDLAKAKESTKDRLREERKPLLAAQDTLFMKAQEEGTSTTDIVTEKNRLRDITNTVDSMTTLAQLRAASCEES